MKIDPLNCLRPPALYDVPQLATRLGLPEIHIPVLVRKGLLSPLGRPAPNSRKLFAAVEVETLVADRNWLDRVARALQKFAREKNLNAGSNSTAKPGVSTPDGGSDE